MDLSWNEHLRDRHNSPLFPRFIRGLIIGKSGCGKTTLLLNLLLREGWLDYNNLKVFGKSLFQPEYRIIKKAFEENLPKRDIVELFKMREEIMRCKVEPTVVLEEISKQHTNANTTPITCEFYELPSDVPNPQDLDKTKKNLMIFDDLQLERQNKCESYYVRGRHSNVDCFYLCPELLQTTQTDHQRELKLYLHIPTGCQECEPYLQ